MAVYKKTYRRYDGPLTAAWSRFLILPRYSLAEMRQRRFFSLFFLGTLICPVVCALIIYLRHNLSALKVMDLDPSKIVSIDSGFFLFYLGFQSMFAFFLAAFVGPGLVSPDLANNALPLYLSRPFGRSGYVLGRMSVLLILLSVMTWVPGLLLFALQGYLEGMGWVTEHARIAVALFLGAWIWVLIVSLMVLALSAWVKWKPVAGGLLFMVFFVGMGFDGIISAFLQTRWGHLINLSHLISVVWLRLFDEPVETGAGAVFFRVLPGGEMPIWAAWAALIGLCLICLHLLGKKIRGMEIVR